MKHNFKYCIYHSLIGFIHRKYRIKFADKCADVSHILNNAVIERRLRQMIDEKETIDGNEIIEIMKTKDGHLRKIKVNEVIGEQVVQKLYIINEVKIINVIH